MRLPILLASLMLVGIGIFFLFGSMTPEGQHMMGQALMRLDSLGVKKECQVLTYGNTHYRWCR